MKKASRILVGLKTLEHVVPLTDVACRLARPNASVMLIHVLELPDPSPLDAEVPELEALAKKILKTGERVVRRGGFKVRTQLLRAHSAGSALLDEMRENRIDMAVIGYHHRRTLGEILLGTVAQHLAKHAPCHLVCLIPPAD